MKKVSVLLFFILMIVTASWAQQKTAFRNCHNYNIKLQEKMGKDFPRVKFKVAGITTQKQADALLKELKSKFEMKREKIKADGSFSAYIKNTVTADQVRDILIKQGYDYDFETVQLMDKALVEKIKSKK